MNLNVEVSYLYQNRTAVMILSLINRVRLRYEKSEREDRSSSILKSAGKTGDVDLLKYILPIW